MLNKTVLGWVMVLMTFISAAAFLAVGQESQVPASVLVETASFDFTLTPIEINTIMQNYPFIHEITSRNGKTSFTINVTTQQENIDLAYEFEDALQSKRSTVIRHFDGSIEDCAPQVHPVLGQRVIICSIRGEIQ